MRIANKGIKTSTTALFMLGCFFSFFIGSSFASENIKCPPGTKKKTTNLDEGGYVKSCRKNGKDEGPALVFNEDGVKVRELQVRGSVKNGPARDFYLSGKISAEQTYVNALTEGDLTEYYESGKKKALRHMIHGIENGHTIFWFENGQIKSEGDVKDGSKNGVWNFYFPSGQKVQSGEYRNDVIFGKQTSWYNSGEKFSEWSPITKQWTFWEKDGTKGFGCYPIVNPDSLKRALAPEDLEGFDGDRLTSCITERFKKLNRPVPLNLPLYGKLESAKLLLTKNMECPGGTYNRGIEEGVHGNGYVKDAPVYVWSCYSQWTPPGSDGVSHRVEYPMVMDNSVARLSQGQYMIWYKSTGTLRELGKSTKGLTCGEFLDYPEPGPGGKRGEPTSHNLGQLNCNEWPPDHGHLWW